jgi:hypothetical protein
MTTYAPSYSYITNYNRAITSNSTAIGYYDFRCYQNTAKALFWHEKKVFIEVTYGRSIKDLAGVTSKKIGTMKTLPDWIMNGAIVSL